MTLEPAPPMRPLSWPPVVRRLAEIIDPPAALLVGGCVRDALRNRPGHDLDLVTFGSGLDAARQIANALHGAYYPLDGERQTGRAIVDADDERFVIDAASLRGEDLLADLQRRDFTINAMAVPLDKLEHIVDPLGGQQDLLTAKLLRQCSPTSISDDPIRALRAVRQSLQLSLRLDPATREAVRSAGALLADKAGSLLQPERVRDELFKLLSSPRPAAGLRLLDALKLLGVIFPLENPDHEWLAARFAVVDALSGLLAIISPQRDDNTAADLTLGVAVMTLDQFRHELQDRLSQTYGDGRARASLLLISGFADSTLDWISWGGSVRLSNAEISTLIGLQKAAAYDWAGATNALSDRMIFQYYRATGEAGVDGVLCWLAEYLASHQPTPDPKDWGRILETIATPLIEAYFRRYLQVIAPQPLVTGDELQRELGIKPGPFIGRFLDMLAEEQAAGEIHTKEQALGLARRLLSENRL